MAEIMLDLETLGTRPGSAIRSVGAALFELDGDGPATAKAVVTRGSETVSGLPVENFVPLTFYSGVRAISCWVAGLTVDKSTLEWWEKQSREAQEAARRDQRDLLEVVESFHAWFARTGARRVWCQGAGFDTVIWERAAAAVERQVPWKFWDVMCTRTLYAVAGFDYRSVPFAGTAHSALDDALHQIKCVQAAKKLIQKIYC